MTEKIIMISGMVLTKKVGLCDYAIAVGEQVPIRGGRLVTVIDATFPDKGDVGGMVVTKELGAIPTRHVRLSWKFTQRKHFPITNHRIIGGVTCALKEFAFSWSLVIGVTGCGAFERRYCYAEKDDALNALNSWNGEKHPPSNWTRLIGKVKGIQSDMLNPNLSEA
ncbi:MAG: hypothetical protein ACTS9Y_00245 [Methylophilus sp.]|uniref:hypothetical protein n=1 Tax=Methylophilus sp. TaxID=29541 RepID=UPI003FA00318